MKALKNISSQPAAWLIVALAGISQLSETVYTPSLPAIARALHTNAGMVEYTLTIYFLGFALGTLFFGKMSDHFGRKPCILLGLLIFVLGCLSCYYSQSITALMWSRLLQSFGASIGSVLAQAVVRDSFHGSALGKMYALVGISLSIFPIIGPMMSTFIAEHFGWAATFLLLALFGFVLIVSVSLTLNETHQRENHRSVLLLDVTWRLLRDKKAMAFGFIVAGANGIFYSYFAEGSFYLMTLLKLSPENYGVTFIFLAAGTFFGGMLARKLHDTHTSQRIMVYGLKIIFGGTLFFSTVILLNVFLPLSGDVLIVVTVVSQMSLMFGVCMATTNALALALVDYKWCIGTASGLFGFFYYIGTSLFTFGMGSLHNGTLFPMPFYFLAISLLMLLVQRALFHEDLPQQ